MTEPSPAGVDALVGGIDVDAVVAAVLATPGVDALDSGRLVRLATYLPGRSVGGVRVDDASVTVQVRADGAVALPELGAELQRRLRALADGRRVDVVISDITIPGADGGTGDG